MKKVFKICHEERRRRIFRHVTVYEVTRHYGGPEEGGWWYNWYKPIESIKVRPCNAEREYQRLIKLYSACDQGDIYSVRGGYKYVIYKECKRHEFATKHVPHYE